VPSLANCPTRTLGTSAPADTQQELQYWDRALALLGTHPRVASRTSLNLCWNRAFCRSMRWAARARDWRPTAARVLSQTTPRKVRTQSLCARTKLSPLRRAADAVMGVLSGQETEGASPLIRFINWACVCPRNLQFRASDLNQRIRGPNLPPAGVATHVHLRKAS
jgi:hypothetical protein